DGGNPVHRTEVCGRKTARRRLEMLVFAVPSWGCSGLEIREKQNQRGLVAMLSPSWLANASWPGATVDFCGKARRTFADFTTREVRRFRTWLESSFAGAEDKRESGPKTSSWGEWFSYYEVSEGMKLNLQVCSRARLSRDPRFDGKFFIGVRGSGV